MGAAEQNYGSYNSSADGRMSALLCPPVTPFHASPCPSMPAMPAAPPAASTGCRLLLAARVPLPCPGALSPFPSPPLPSCLPAASRPSTSPCRPVRPACTQAAQPQPAEGSEEAAEAALLSAHLDATLCSCLCSLAEVLLTKAQQGEPGEHGMGRQ